MQKEIITVTMRWPDKSLGLDVDHVKVALDQFIRRYHGIKHVFHCGSGRTIKMETDRKRRKTKTEI